MEKERLDDLKQHYDFEAWCGSNSLRENLFIWNYLLNGGEFPGWQLHVNRSVGMPGWPPLIQSVWRRSDDDDETVLRLDIYQCSSRQKAHEFLVNVLGQVHLPTMSRQAAVDIGDVAFTGSTDTGVLFARANLVFVALNAGRRLEPIIEQVSNFDKDICSKPTVARRLKATPEIRRLESPAKEFQVGENIPIELEAVDPLRKDRVLRLEGEKAVQPESSLYLKFFSPLSGEVLMEENRLVYKPTAMGLQEVSVYAVSVAQAANRQVVQFEVS